MRISVGIARATLAIAVIVPVLPVHAQANSATQWTDWGGGYLRGPDSASTTVATSGAGTPKPNN